MTNEQLIKFIWESNKIEGIRDEITEQDLLAYRQLLALKVITIPDLERFVSVIEPGAKLRDQKGMDVRVGLHVFPWGGAEMPLKLHSMLKRLNDVSAYHIHLAYEALHPFTDGNRRSGRALWLWQMKEAPLGFLHEFYLQTLREETGETDKRGGLL